MPFISHLAILHLMQIEKLLPSDLQAIAQKVIQGERINEQECLLLYQKASLPELGILARVVRVRINSENVFFNRNIHLEPTNICVNRCKFCSYRRTEGESGSWDWSIEEVFQKLDELREREFNEIHIVGGVHPNKDFTYYQDLIGGIHKRFPSIHIKAFTAEELCKMAQQSKQTVKKVLLCLKQLGLDSLPGGGAEILNDDVRKQVCGDKINSESWLSVHKSAHEMGIPSNATMLYGHVENYEHRVEHLSKLRQLQDKTNSFNAFIPLKFRNGNNALSHLSEVSAIEDLRNMAICRIFLDNIPHLKAYWVMLGKELAQLALSFGADDIDGTIGDSTKIYSLAGVEDKSPTMSVEELCNMVRQAGFKPVERDSLYRIIKHY
ncbi:MAG: aminofutalosine synthase MqnE [Bacteroidales bacterium]